MKRAQYHSPQAIGPFVRAAGGRLHQRPAAQDDEDADGMKAEPGKFDPGQPKESR